jgi:hypothetical protein
MPTAYVLGARPGSNNIGDAVSKWFWGHDWGVIQDDAVAADAPDPDTRPRGVNADEPVRRGPLGYGGANGWERYEAPSVQDFAKADASALVITLGRTYKDHFTEVAGLRHRAHDQSKPDPASRSRAPVRPLRERIKARTAPIRTTIDGSAKIIFVGSYAHDHPFTNGTLYCAAKAGLNMAARTLGWELTTWGTGSTWFTRTTSTGPRCGPRSSATSWLQGDDLGGGRRLQPQGPQDARPPHARRRSLR